MRETPDEDHPRPLPEKLDDYTAEQLEQLADADPKVIAEAVRKTIGLSGDALCGQAEELKKILALGAKACPRIGDLRYGVRVAFRTRLMELAKDLQIMLDMGGLDDDARTHLLVLFLQFTDDDDDDDVEEPEPAPQSEDRVPV